jgi:hypothetical protein
MFTKRLFTVTLVLLFLVIATSTQSLAGSALY